MNRTSMRLWAGFFVFVVFSGGLAAGFAVRPWFDPDPPRRSRGRGEASRSPSVRPSERLLNRLDDRLDADNALSDDQRGRLREVFDAGQLRFRELNAGVREQFEAERAQMNAEIATILTAEQMQVFESQVVRMRRDRRDRFGPRGPDDGREPRRDRPGRSPR